MRRAYISEDLLCQVHDLLRGSGALDRRVGKGEDAVALLEVADGLPGLVHVGGAVVGPHARGLKSVQKACDLKNY